jgi:hypothetical protein
MCTISTKAFESLTHAMRNMGAYDLVFVPEPSRHPIQDSRLIYLSVLVIFTIVKTMSLIKPFFSIVCTESICKYVCRVYHQLSQYIAKLRQITIDLCKSCLVTIETPRNHSLTQHQIVFAILEKYIGFFTNIVFKSHQT